MKPLLSASSAGHRPTKPQFLRDQDSEISSVRYSRLASFEAVLSIRDQRRAERRLIVGALIAIGTLAIVAGTLGWL